MKPRTRQWLWVASLVGLFLGLAAGYQHFVLSAPPDAFHWVRHGVTYELLAPRMLGFLLVIPLLLFVLGKSLADLPWQQRVLSLLFRTVFIALLAVGLSRPARTAHSDRICSVYLVDVSDSVSDQALSDARKVVQQALQGKRPQDLVKVITFARRPRLVAADARHGPLESFPIQRHDPKAQPVRWGAGTNIQAALQHAYGLYPPGFIKRAVILSDGLQTDGNLLAEVSRARKLGVRVYTLAYHRPVPAEVAIRGVGMPDRVKIGQPFDIHASIYSSRKATARLRLFQGEALNGLDGIRTIELKPGINDVTFQSVVRVGGTVTYDLVLDHLSADKFKENNRFSATIEVPGRPTVLYVEGRTQYANYLASALGAQQFDVDVRTPEAFPGSLRELERYDFVILSDVPANKVTLASQDLIEQYVKVLGGGFLFAGGESGYGLGGWSGKPLARILPVRMDTQHRKETPSLAMVLVIDRSGSMTGLPMEMAKEAAKATVGVLASSDLIEVIAFDSKPTRYVKMQPARNRSRIMNNIARIQAGGGTQIFSALDAAYQDLTITEARKKHVILLSDGRSPTAGIRDLVQAMVAESMTITTVGLGSEADDQLLQTIADLGGGRYHKVTDPNALPRVFTRETEMVARQAAVEDWFPVSQVAPADFLRGISIGSAPLLHGYVATTMKPPPAQLVLASDKGEPILARWHVGSGWVVAWTSDVKNLWAVEWLRWKGYGQFWGQLVREHMRKKHRRELDMRASIIDGKLHAVVDAFAVDDRFENGLASTLEVEGPQPKGTKRSFPMKQTAPGRYEAIVPLKKFGSYLLRATHMRPDDKGNMRQVAVSYGHVSYPYPREYARFEPDLALLRNAALVTGGSFEPDVAKIFDPGKEKILYHQDLWMRAALAAIAVFLIDLFLRRVRLFDRKFLPKKTRRVA